MSEILFHYQKVHPATWVYLSSLLMIGLFFKFNRFWSVRNADLILLILLSPGLLLVNFGQEARQAARDQLIEAQRAIPCVSLIGRAEAAADEIADDTAVADRFDE